MRIESGEDSFDDEEDVVARLGASAATAEASSASATETESVRLICLLLGSAGRNHPVGNHSRSIPHVALVFQITNMETLVNALRHTGSSCRLSRHRVTVC